MYVSGTVQSLSLFNAKLQGVGSLYTCLVRPSPSAKEAAFNVTVQVKGGACHNRQHRPNLVSNEVVIPIDHQVRGGA
eukprot:1178817-Prorocentrum_minimum.AAC.2